MLFSQFQEPNTALDFSANPPVFSRLTRRSNASNDENLSAINISTEISEKLCRHNSTPILTQISDLYSRFPRSLRNNSNFQSNNQSITTNQVFYRSESDKAQDEAFIIILAKFINKLPAFLQRRVQKIDSLYSLINTLAYLSHYCKDEYSNSPFSESKLIFD